MDNPYQPPTDAPVRDDDVIGRPLGVSLLAVLTGILGLLLLALYVFLLINVRENNEFFLQRGMPPALFWVMTGLTVVLALACSVGTWRGAKWSWWIMCSVLVLYVVSNFGGAAAIVVAGGVRELELIPVARAIRSLVLSVAFALLLRYWLSRRVRRYFQFETAGGIKAILLSGLAGIGIIFVITLVLFILHVRGDR
jgi:hypothetical protein